MMRSISNLKTGLPTGCLNRTVSSTIKSLDWWKRGLGVPHEKLKLIHLGFIIYAGLYLIEGVGLLFDKKWAEWMVVVTTAGFIPFELYEIFSVFWEKHEVSWFALVIFVLNIVVLAYLCFRLRRVAVLKKELRAMLVEPSKA